jgi:hypothetical protein
MSARTRKTQACEKKFVGSRKTERLGENRLAQDSGLRVATENWPGERW